MGSLPAYGSAWYANCNHTLPQYRIAHSTIRFSVPHTAQRVHMGSICQYRTAHSACARSSIAYTSTGHRIASTLSVRDIVA
eukprot:1033875-Rhodomonas_salina.3